MHLFVYFKEPSHQIAAKAHEGEKTLNLKTKASFQLFCYIYIYIYIRFLFPPLLILDTAG